MKEMTETISILTLLPGLNDVVVVFVVTVVGHGFTVEQHLLAAPLNFISVPQESKDA